MSCYDVTWTSLVAQLVKKSTCNAGDDSWVWSLGWDNPLEKGKATHFSILSWRIPWTLVHGAAKSQTRLSDFHFTWCYTGFPRGSVVKNPPANAGDRDTSSIPGSGRSPGEGNSNTLQYSCLENPMQRRAWWDTVHGVAKESDTT